MSRMTYFKVFVIMLLKIVFHRKINSPIKVDWTYGASPNSVIFLRIHDFYTIIWAHRIVFEDFTLTLTFRPGVTGFSIKPLFFSVIMLPKVKKNIK